MRIARHCYSAATLICVISLHMSTQIDAQVKQPIKPAQPPPSVQMQPTPATCPAGYIVGGKLVPKSQFQTATPSPAKPAQTLPTKPVVPSAPSLPTKPTLPQKPIIQPPQIQLPRITHVAWNFKTGVLEIHGTGFVDPTAPPYPQQYSRLSVNGGLEQEYPIDDHRAPTVRKAGLVRQSGCYQFVIQRMVLKDGPQPGPQSLPYQEFVHVPKLAVPHISVADRPVSPDQPMSYEIRGTNIGGLGPTTQIWAMALRRGQNPDQILPDRFPDGSTSKVMTLDQVQVLDPHTIVVTNDLVQGLTHHFIKYSDPHYGMVETNRTGRDLPRRLIIEQVVPADVGYRLTGLNLGSDLNQLRVLENNAPVPQGNLSLKMPDANRTEIHVNNPNATGAITHQISSLTPGIQPSRRVAFTHPPIPVITGLEMTNYGFDVVGSNLGNDPVLGLFTGPTTDFRIFAGNTQFNASFFRQVSNSRIAVNYAAGCVRLPLQRNVQTQVQVSGASQGVKRNSLPFPFTFPQTWSQYTPAIASVTKTPDGLQIAGSNLGQAHEVCQIDVETIAPNGPGQAVSGSVAPNDFLSVTDTLLRVRMNPVPSGQSTVTVRRAGMSSQPFFVNLGP